MSCVLCVVGYVYIIYAITTGKMSFTHQETTCWSWLQFGFSIATFDFLAIRCTLDRKNKIAGTPRVRGIELKTLASQVPTKRPQRGLGHLASDHGHHHDDATALLFGVVRRAALDSHRMPRRHPFCCTPAGEM